MPIPYMWSKRKSARHIYNIIEAHTKDRKEDLLVDLFTGWFAISEIFIQEGWKTINNDKNKYVMALLEKILEWLPDNIYDWVSRDKFYDVINNPDNYEDWYVWFIQCVWSFGSTQTNYMYWKNIEYIKRIANDFVVNKNIDKIIKDIIPKKYIEWILKQDTIWKRRMALKKVANMLFNKFNKIYKKEYKIYKKIMDNPLWKEYALIFTKWLKSTWITNKEINKLTNSNMWWHYLTQASQPAIPTPEMMDLIKKSNKIKNIPQNIYDLVYDDDYIIKLKKEMIINLLNNKDIIKKLDIIDILENIERIQNLNNLENIQRLERLLSIKVNKQNILSINKWSYNEVEIPKNAVVYCDPPYAWTAEYAEWWFNHEEFWEYIRKLSRTNKVFISEYTAPDDFKVIYRFPQKSSLSGWNQSHNNQPDECLFVYNW